MIIVSVFKTHRLLEVLNQCIAVEYTTLAVLCIARDDAQCAIL